MFTDLLHWFVHDARIWVTDTARAYPYWCFPIAFGVAFRNRSQVSRSRSPALRC